MTTQLSRRALLRGTLAATATLCAFPAMAVQLGPPAGKIALRFNENPYGPSPRALEAARKAAKLGAYYADDVEVALQSKLAELNGLSSQSLVISSGSNEALQAAMLAWGKSGKVLMPELTYTAHVGYARRKGVEIVTVPLAEDMGIDLDAMAAAVDDSVSLVYISNPNNPTSMALDGDALRDFCRTVGDKAVVLVDEAYIDVVDEPEKTSMLSLVHEEQSVVIARTFSKLFGMAGMRVGYCLARPDLTAKIRDYVMAWPNGVGLAAALASIEDDEFIEFSRDKILKGRDMVVNTFRKNGIEPLPSQTNFVYADIGRDANEMQRQMRDKGILIRGAYGKFSTYSRVSMGRLEELEVFDRVFTEVYRG